MYEALDLSIPDVDAYLDRFHGERPRRPDREALDALVCAHQCNVVFENLDPCILRQPVSLEIPLLYEKFVTRRRGGYCFEQNALFTQLLKDLGYRATACMCRITKNPGEITPIMHRGIIVHFENDMVFCDVGFGGPAAPGCLPIIDGSRTSFGQEEYQISRADDDWWNISRTTSVGKQEMVMQFFCMPQENMDFIPFNEFCARSPESPFTQMLFLNLRRPEGSVSLLGDTFTCTSKGHANSRKVRDLADLLQLLQDPFGFDGDFCRTLDPQQLAIAASL